MKMQMKKDHASSFASRRERVKIFLLGLVTSGELYERMFLIEIYLALAMVFRELIKGSQKTPNSGDLGRVLIGISGLMNHICVFWVH